MTIYKIYKPAGQRQSWKINDIFYGTRTKQIVLLLKSDRMFASENVKRMPKKQLFSD